jgi:hypothetical protein
MTVEEWAALEQRLGGTVVKTGGVWWRRSRPLFYRPLFPFEALPRKVVPPPLARLGGWQHAVPEGAVHNAHLNFMVFLGPQHYDPGKLLRGDRQSLKRAARSLTYRRITDAHELATEGFRVLREFFSRNDYEYRRDRLRPAVFRRWAEGLINEPKVLVLGAYSKAGLCEVEVSFRVRDILFFEVTFSSHEGRSLHSADGVLDWLRREAAATDVSMICVGPACAKSRLDGFKLRRGGAVISVPAYLHLSPLSQLLLKLATPAIYGRLLGLDSAKTTDYMAACPRA